ncbi:MAG TPA: hypothetical protein VF263_25115, partial [Longimicrobiaceae bacterium]
VAARAPLPRGATLEVSGGFARGTLQRPDGSSASLSGPLDTELRLGAPVAGDLLGVAAVVVLPTGRSAHTREEAEVAGAVAADLLPFRVSRWGTGGGVGASATLAHTAGGFGLGASVGYVAAREYEPFAGESFAYRPGDQLRVRAAVDRTVGTASKASLRLDFQRYGEDRLDGAGLFRAGSRYGAVASYAFPAGGAAGGIAWGGWSRREQGSFPGDPLRDAPSQDLLLLGGGLRVPTARGVLVPTLDARLLRTGGADATGYLAGAGLAMELPAGSLTVVPSVRARLGRVAPGAGVESGVAGAEVGVTLRHGRPLR